MIIAANSLAGLQLRPICYEDNATLAKIIRAALIEFDANQPGSAFDDKSTDSLFALFQTHRSVYYVAELENNIFGEV